MNNKEKNIKDFSEKFDSKLLNESSFNNLITRNYKEEKNIIKQNTKETKKLNGHYEHGKISIIIPTYNRLEQLTECVNSILKQTYRNFEIIIVDDSSNKDTMNKYSNSFNNQIKYYKNQKNLGMGMNRQKGYNLSNGDFIIFCDDDDYYIDNEYFQDAINFFKDKNINIVCSNSYIHYESEDLFTIHNLNLKEEINSIDYLKEFQFNFKKPTSTFPAIFRKGCLEKANFKDMKMMNDSSIYLRAMMVGGKTKFNNKIVGVYRVHEKNDTFNVKADFAIQNLEEKKYVYEFLLKNNKFNTLKQWYEKEIEVTVRHFLRGKENRKEEINKVLNWVEDNVSKKLKFYCYLIYLKKKIKKCLREK